MKTDLKLSFNPTLEEVIDECETLENKLVEEGLDPESALKVRCIAHELFVNAVIHGRHKKENGNLLLNLKIRKGRINLMFIDEGEKWTPDRSVIDSPFHYNSDDALYSYSGKGLRMIGAMCSSFHMYRFKDRNLTFISVEKN